METILDLGDGLIMRRAVAEDADRIAAFNTRIHGEDPFDGEAVAVWTRDLMLYPPPGFTAGDFLIVEDARTGEIVSSLNMISQTWSYEGIPFGVGRPELVGTDAKYRNRGLVRKQFDVAHQWSLERGQLVQVITGIPYFYRQFGYEMGLDLGGGRIGYQPRLPKLEEGKAEPYTIRKAQDADLPFIMRMYERECRRSMISAVRDEATWCNELFQKSHKNVNRVEIRIIEQEGRPVGYFAMPWYTWGTLQAATRFELDEGVSYFAVTPVVLRYLWQVGLEHAPEREKTLDSFGLMLGAEHPAYQAAGDRLVYHRRPYAYFVRVPDLPAFLQRIAPALENRLATSICAGHTGELKISFYRKGIRLVFTAGKLTCAEPWAPTHEDEGMAGFPDLTFLQLLFGYRTLEELRYAFADCWANEEARALLESLFPKKASSVWGVC